ncbi:Uu.00g098380.m01.CDS01 [Anthostomella pinea]|uniref:laccase n=1 Tax=Anthostomella pinea TaxID=933095 RepID=A0AAI8VCL3_9PEZI|nr:Uu.00g098380.m01.CDS01 [Anthostomella pinea]
MRTSSLLSGLSALGSLALVAAAPFAESNVLSKRCDFDSAASPDCWGDYSLSTNWYDDAPDTGVIREYWLQLVNTTLAPDGVERMVLTVNGTIPGPTITADWGDTVVVHVHNGLQDNGTSIHWHGIRQFGTNEADGVASITQCPAAPGEDLTYTWKATQYGTTWYHSHFSLQAWNGVFGGIIINGPASAPYDEDKGLIIINDWYHQTSDQLYAAASTSGPPTPENGLINGLNVYGDGGSRFETSFTSGTSYRLRIVNTAMDNMFKFTIDNHTMTVISSDLVPIVPYETDTIFIGIGQRYDVVVKADQAAGNYWMRSIPQLSCGSNGMTLNIKAIVTYDGVDVAEPESEAWDSASVDDCLDELSSNLVPFVALDAGDAVVEEVLDIGISIVNSFFKWTVNSNTFLSDWGTPTLQKVISDGSTYTAEENIITLNETNKWVYLVIESQLGLTHPIHLHGHDFFVLGKESGATFTTDASLNLVNPPRRDVVMLPASGYVAIAFVSDNPGVWLAHCHIGWHTSQGFALQLVERASEIAATVDSKVVDDTCAAWNAYASAGAVVQEDSGV